MRNNVKRSATVFLSFILDLLVIYAGFKVADYITMYFTGMYKYCQYQIVICRGVVVQLQMPSLCKGRWHTKCDGRVVCYYDNPSVKPSV